MRLCWCMSYYRSKVIKTIISLSLGMSALGNICVPPLHWIFLSTNFWHRFMPSGIQKRYAYKMYVMFFLYILSIKFNYDVDACYYIVSLNIRIRLSVLLSTNIGYVYNGGIKTFQGTSKVLNKAIVGVHE